MLELLLVEIKSGSELAQFFSLYDGHLAVFSHFMLRHLSVNGLSFICLLGIHVHCLSNHRHAEKIHER